MDVIRENWVVVGLVALALLTYLIPKSWNRIYLFRYEWGHPDRTCARVGHDLWTKWRRGYTRSRRSYCVADRVLQTKEGVCRRCGHGEENSWVDKDRTGLSGLTLDSDKMETLDLKGEVWFDTGYVRPDDPIDSPR